MLIKLILLLFSAIMQTDYRKNLRKTILHLMYQYSNGNEWNFVLWEKLSKELGFSTGNNEDFFGALKYLTDKGYLKTASNMEEQITSLGIDEVEGNFPSLDGEIILEGSLVQTKHNLSLILYDINKIIEKNKEGLLERPILHSFDIEVEKRLKEAFENLQEDDRLRLKKITSGFRNHPKPDFCLEGEANKVLDKYITLIEVTLQSLTGETYRTEAYIPTGRPFDGRKQLRSILNTAKKEILLVDSYMHPDILSVICINVEKIPDLTIKFLTSQQNKKKFNSFVSDLRLFKQQYPKVRVDCIENDKAHGRFIVIDNTDLYHSGNSFDNLGVKGDHINKIEEDQSIKQNIEDINNWLSAGISIDLNE